MFPALLLLGRPHYNGHFRCGSQHHDQHWNRKLHPDGAVSSTHGHRCSDALHRLLLWIHHLLSVQTQPTVSPQGQEMFQYEFQT